MSRFVSLLSAAALGCGLLLSAGPAQAQHHGGGHGGGGHSGGYHGGSYHGGGYHGGGYHGGYYHGGYGYRYGPSIGIGIYPRSYYGGYYSGYYEPPVYVEPYGEPDVVAVEPEESEAITPAEPAARTETRIRVMLPDPNATVWMDGAQSTLSGNSRIFDFPNEAANQMYTHKVKASWFQGDRLVTQEREVRVASRSEMIVDFRRPAATSSTMPPAPPE